MKTRGIIMGAPMVKALLDGRKTQTRRIVRHEIRGPNPPNPPGLFDHYIRGKWEGAHKTGDSKSNALSLCPYGVAGDRLWVRETYCNDEEGQQRVVFYKATDHPTCGQPWKSARYMPKEFARIWLEITRVRVERVQDISQENAKAEGVRDTALFSVPNAIANYMQLWDSLHGKGAWARNDWVWVLEFKKCEY